MIRIRISSTRRSGDDADQRADDEPYADRNEGARQGLHRAIDDASEQITAQLVGAEPMGGPGRQTAFACDALDGAEAGAGPRDRGPEQGRADNRN